MCNIIVINLGEKEIESPKEFREHFGFDALIAPHYKEIIEDSCLCQCDIEATLNEKSIPYKTNGYDFFVGKLENYIEE